MSVSAGYNGTIRIKTSDATLETVGEMGSWSISGPNRNMIEVSAFGDTVARQEIGTLTGQTITFDGYYDGTSTALRKIVTSLSSRTPVRCSTIGGLFPANLRLYTNVADDLPGAGYWSLSTAGTTTATVYITGMELGQSKDGLGAISFTAAVSGDDMKWSTSTG